MPSYLLAFTIENTTAKDQFIKTLSDNGWKSIHDTLFHKKGTQNDIDDLLYYIEVMGHLNSSKDRVDFFEIVKHHKAM